jgi:hypothetical protein
MKQRPLHLPPLLAVVASGDDRGILEPAVLAAPDTIWVIVSLTPPSESKVGLSASEESRVVSGGSLCGLSFRLCAENSSIRGLCSVDSICTVV